VTTHREHTCAQCGTLFEAQRSTATFCSTKCRMAHMRGRKRSDANHQHLRSFLQRHGLAQGGALNVSPTVALGELNASLERFQGHGLKTVLQPFTESAFRTALKEAGLATA
jgi:hypothetical protein